MNNTDKNVNWNLNIKKAFTIVEVSILFVIFLIVAFLVAPLSLDDTRQANNTHRWQNVQSDFDNIYNTINTHKGYDGFDFKNEFNSTLKGQIKIDTEPYVIRNMNGSMPQDLYIFKEFSLTYSNATIAYKLFNEPKDEIIGVMMYDVNGSASPNTWGKDVFGYNVTANGFEPFCKNESITNQKKDCRNGTGLCCSNYYLIGGSLR